MVWFQAKTNIFFKFVEKHWNNATEKNQYDSIINYNVSKNIFVKGILLSLLIYIVWNQNIFVKGILLSLFIYIVWNQNIFSLK